MTDDEKKACKQQQDAANAAQNSYVNEKKQESLKQPKQLKISMLRPKDELHPGGFIFRIIDNDGATVLKEWWDSDQRIGVQFCRNWLKIRAGEELELEFYTHPPPTLKVETSKETDAEPK